MTRWPLIRRSRHDAIVGFEHELTRLAERAMDEAREENTMLRRAFGVPERFSIYREWQEARRAEGKPV